MESLQNKNDQSKNMAAAPKGHSDTSYEYVILHKRGGVSDNAQQNNYW